MDIDELKQKKVQMELDIKNSLQSIIAEFEKDTGMELVSININDAIIDTSDKQHNWSELASALAEPQPHPLSALEVKANIDFLKDSQ